MPKSLRSAGERRSRAGSNPALSIGGASVQRTNGPPFRGKPGERRGTSRKSRQLWCTRTASRLPRRNGATATLSGCPVSLWAQVRVMNAVFPNSPPLRAPQDQASDFSRAIKRRRSGVGNPAWTTGGSQPERAQGRVRHTGEVSLRKTAPPERCDRGSNPLLSTAVNQSVTAGIPKEG